MLLVLLGLIVGAILGFVIARKVMADYMKKNPKKTQIPQQKILSKKKN